ncbi:MAG: pimeloyl-ACP methyl ester carboxylesterase [Flavobacteriales bacterium]|jgi:pimeloyl-ACP methyl ester carboxylesterase
MDIKHISHKGFSFRYNIQGEGVPLVFVGGAFQSIEKLGPLSDHWKERYQLVLIELPGFGESDFLPENKGFDYTAECIDKVCRQLKLSNMIMIGTSYGSPSVFRYVANNQNAVLAMILGGTCTSIDKLMEYQVRVMLWIMRSKSSYMFPKAFTEVMCNIHVEAIPKLARIQQVLMRSLIRLGEDAKEKFFANSMRLLGEKLPKLKVHVPTLVFTGEYDQFTRSDRLEEFHEYCSDLQIERIKNSDHMYHLEQTEETLALIDRFVSEKLSEQHEEPYKMAS